MPTLWLPIGVYFNVYPPRIGSWIKKKKSSPATDGAAATRVRETADKNKHGERVIRVLFVYRLAVRKSGLPPASTVTLFTFFSDCKRFSDHRIRAVLPNTVIQIPTDMTVAKVWIFFCHFLEPSMTDPIFLQIDFSKLWYHNLFIFLFIKEEILV